MLKRTCVSTLIFSVGLLVSALSHSGAEVSSLVRSIMTEQSKALSRLQTVRFSSNLDLELGPERLARVRLRSGSAPAHIFNDLVFAAKGSRYRSAFSVSDSEGTTSGATVIAWDGRRYQVANSAGGGSVSTSKTQAKPDPYGTSNALLLPYEYAFWSGDLKTLSHLRSPATWSKLAKAAREVKEATVDGHQGITVSFAVTAASTNKKLTYNVFFARDLGYFPLQWDLHYPDGRISTCRVTSTKVFGSDTERIVLPLRIEGTEEKDGRVRSRTTIEVDPASLQVNEQVEDSLFTLPAS